MPGTQEHELDDEKDDAPATALPQRISGLGPLSENLWWSWQPHAEGLYRDLDPFLFASVEENPVLLLRARGAGAAAAGGCRPRLPGSLRRRSWRSSTHCSTPIPRVNLGRRAVSPSWSSGPSPIFPPSSASTPRLPIYSGGLGVLAGDHAKAASDLGLPLVGISLLYRQGYLRQRLNHDGWQLDVTPSSNPAPSRPRWCSAPDGEPLCVEIVLDDPAAPVRIQIWRVQVGRVSLYLLDADVEGNPDWTRTVSSRLYGGDQEHRLRQEKILGIGGVRALRAMGIDPVYWHGNEGHAGFHLLERAREWVAEGLTFDEAAERVIASSVFTSHTPVPAGHDVFPPHLMDRYFSYLLAAARADRARSSWPSGTTTPAATGST